MTTAQMSEFIEQLRGTIRLREEAALTDGQLLEDFIRRRDQAAGVALTVLVRRHGPMVWGVCRRVLDNYHDAEDAFQATFLVLVRKATTIVPREMVANWLYGVAHQTAMKARATSSKRKQRERQVTPLPEPGAVEERFWHDVQPILDQELERLPDRYRSVIVLCHLEGKTRKEAAEQLGCPEGTVAGRLARAREMLGQRLARRGIAVSGAALAGMLAENAPAAVPAFIMSSTMTAAALFAEGPAGALAPSVLALAEGVLKLMVITRLKTAASILTAVLACIGAGTIALLPTTPAQPPASTQTADKKKPASLSPAPARNETGWLEGRCTAADTGKPVAGARVRVLVQGIPGKRPIAEAVSDAEGRYALELPLGHSSLWGVSGPAGFFTQDAKTYGQIIVTTKDPRITRNFVLQPGTPWQLELKGVKPPLEMPPHFSAVPNPSQDWQATGVVIHGVGDKQGKAVATIPRAGGYFRFSFQLAAFPNPYEIPAANLEVDKEFDPRQVKGDPEPLVGRDAVRLRDTAGRSAVVEGVEVAVVAGRAVLLFQAKPIPTASAVAFQGRVVDEAGKPIAGASWTAGFLTSHGGSMTSLEATTNKAGRFELSDVRLPAASFADDQRITLMVVKAGYDGMRTKELMLADVKKAGHGDFGTVILKPGRTLRGRVVDENGQPAQGALVTNLTDYFLYSHLRCRTDAGGRFVMPDLSYGRQKVSAAYGERGGQEEFDFNDKNQECVITVRLIPKSGARPVPVPRQSPPKPPPEALAQHDESWDLTLPRKEPRYKHEPRYALLVFGPKRQHRVWLVLDGTTLYVDCNGNGDLTEPDKRLEPKNPTDDSNRFSNAGSHTHFDVFDFTVQTATKEMSRFVLHHWIRAESYTPKTDLEKEWHTKWLALRYENSTLWRKEGLGQGQTPLIFMPKPADAQVCALDGPLTFAVKMPDRQVLQRGEAGGDVAFHIVVPGRPYRGADQALFNALSTKEVPEAAYLEVDIEYPGKTAKDPPLRRKYLLKQRC